MVRRRTVESLRIPPTVHPAPLDKLGTRGESSSLHLAKSKCRTCATLSVKSVLLCGLDLTPPRVQHRFGIAVRCLSSLENQIQGCLKGDAFFKLRHHLAIVRVVFVLSVHDPGHSFKGLLDLLFADDTVV